MGYFKVLLTLACLQCCLTVPAPESGYAEGHLKGLTPTVEDESAFDVDQEVSRLSRQPIITLESEVKRADLVRQSVQGDLARSLNQAQEDSQDFPETTEDDEDGSDLGQQGSGDGDFEGNASIDEAFSNRRGFKPELSGEIPDIPSEDSEEDTEGDLPDGYEVPCVPSFKEVVRFEDRLECAENTEIKCQIKDYNQCEEECRDSEDHESVVAEEEVCVLKESQECVDKDESVCIDVDVAVQKTVVEEVCEDVPKQDCQIIDIQKCETIDEEVCEDKPVTIDVTIQENVCNTVIVEECNEVNRTVCNDVISTEVVKLTEKKCKPVTIQVCKDMWKSECKEVPKKQCKEIWINEMIWVMKNHCDDTVWDTPAKPWKLSAIPHKSWHSGSSQSGWGQWKEKLHNLVKRSFGSKAKCWPVKEWKSVPKAKTVCTEVWENVCQQVWKPWCDHRVEESCNDVPVVTTQNVTKNVCEEVPTKLCHENPKEECVLQDKIVPQETFEKDCQIVPREDCFVVPSESCDEKFEKECREEERVIESFEKQPECETKKVPDCKTVAKPVCEIVKKSVANPDFKNRCIDLCLEQADQECLRSPEKQCATIRMEIVENVPDVVC